MLKFNKMVLLGTMVVTIIATSVTAFAATSSEGGISVSNLEELKKQRLETKIEILEDRVDAGIITRSQADEIIARIEANQAVCDGTSNLRMGKGMGLGFGQGRGLGQGIGQGTCGNCTQIQK